MRNLTRELEVAAEDLAMISAADTVRRGVTAAEATLGRLADRINVGLPSGGGQRGGKGGHSDPTLAAMGEYGPPLDPDTKKPIPGARPVHRPRRGVEDGRLRAELDECLQAIVRNLRRAREIVVDEAPLDVVDLSKVDPCGNIDCENVVMGMTSSDRLRVWHRLTPQLCPRCYQHMDAQHRAGVAEVDCLLYPHDARPRDGRLTRKGADSFRNWATREGSGAA